MRKFYQILEDVHDPYNIKTIDDEECKILRSISGIGRMRIGNKEYSVFVCGHVSDIPHMHIIDYKTAGRKFHACVSLERPEYLDFDFTQKSRLTKKMKHELVELLKPIPGRCFYYDLWAAAVGFWNLCNSDRQIPENIEMPDYMKL